MIHYCQIKVRNMILMNQFKMNNSFKFKKKLIYKTN